jgi:hypothetical protein
MTAINLKCGFWLFVLSSINLKHHPNQTKIGGILKERKSSLNFIGAKVGPSENREGDYIS